MSKKNIKVERFPRAKDKSLRAWSAADEYLVSLFEVDKKDNASVFIYNDRFGYLTCLLNESNPTVISTFRSQEEGITHNLKKNQLKEVSFKSPLEDIQKRVDAAMIKVPKSMDLFRLFLIDVHRHSTSDTIVYCGFMTKYFTKQMLEVAEEYFADVQQTLAKKKARVLILSKPIALPSYNNTRTINHSAEGENISLTQYFGVFSAKHIDYATQFLLSHIKVKEGESKVLDLASGNGILAHEILRSNPNVEIHLMDDSFIAVESSKMNLPEGNVHFHYNYRLDHFEPQSFDLIVCNPPFHFEHENTIEIALSLFQGVHTVLKPDGRFICVANNHLNYKIHLERLFSQVLVVGMNKKFVVYECSP